MKRISIRQPIIDAIDETDSSLARFQNQMLKWARYLEKEIGSKQGYTYTSKLFTVTGCTITLPDDCYHVVGVLPGDYTDECNARYQSIEWLSVRNDDTRSTDDEDLTLLWRPAETTWVNPYVWEEIGNVINLTIEYEGVEMTMLYQKIETDSQGYWIINESHSDAIKKYIIYMTSKKYGWKIFKSDKLLRQGHVNYIEGLKQEYNMAVRHARAEDGKETPYQKERY